jgi:hypothetical protein
VATSSLPLHHAQQPAPHDAPRPRPQPLAHGAHPWLLNALRQLSGIPEHKVGGGLTITPAKHTWPRPDRLPRAQWRTLALPSSNLVETGRPGFWNLRAGRNCRARTHGPTNRANHVASFTWVFRPGTLLPCAALASVSSNQPSRCARPASNRHQTVPARSPTSSKLGCMLTDASPLVRGDSIGCSWGPRVQLRIAMQRVMPAPGCSWLHPMEPA